MKTWCCKEDSSYCSSFRSLFINVYILSNNKKHRTVIFAYLFLNNKK